MKKINWDYKFNPTQKRLFIFAFVNIYFGMIMIATSNLITTYLSNELWHKIIIFNGLNIPIGILEIILFISISTFLNILCIMIDISVLKNGLDVIKVTENKKTEKVEYSC
jgi:hypothetical protein